MDLQPRGQRTLLVSSSRCIPFLLLTPLLFGLDLMKNSTKLGDVLRLRRYLALPR